MSAITGLGISQEQIEAYRQRFETLTNLQRDMAIMHAQGVNYKVIAKLHKVSSTVFNRELSVVLATLECTKGELPKAVFASLGVLLEHQI